MKEETFWKTPTGITKTTTQEEYEQAEKMGYERYLTQDEFMEEAISEQSE